MVTKEAVIWAIVLLLGSAPIGIIINWWLEGEKLDNMIHDAKKEAGENKKNTYHIAVCHDCKRQRIFPYTLPADEKFIAFLEKHKGHNMKFIPNGELNKEMVWED